MTEQDRTRAPTTNDLWKLPRWARVAFAARCAKRVLPLYEKWSQTTKLRIEAVPWAVEVAEQSAAAGAAYAVPAFPNAYGAHPGVAAIAYAAQAAQAAQAARVANDANAANASNATSAAYAAYAVAYNAAYANAGYANAGYASAGYANAGYTSADAVVAAAASLTADYAVLAAYAVVFGADAARAAMWRDYDVLDEGQREQGWTDDTPVSPSFVGPLWPDVESEWWPTGGGKPTGGLGQRPGGFLLPLTSLTRERLRPKDASAASSESVESPPPAPDPVAKGGRMLQDIHDALVEAFTGWDDLSKMVRFGLDEKLEDIVVRSNTSTAVFMLIEWAKAHDRLEDLIRAAREQNPSNPLLREVAESCLPRLPTRKKRRRRW